MKKILSTVLFTLMLGLLGWYLYANRADLAQLLTLSPGLIAGMLLLALAACCVNCYYHKLILDTYGLPMDVTDWMGVVFASNAMAYVLPMRMDLIFTATYYRRVKGLAYVKSASVAAGNIVFGVLFALLQMLAALLALGLIEGKWPPVLWLALGALMAVMAAFLVLALWFEDRMPACLRRIRVIPQVVSGFNALLRNRGLLIRLLVCMTVNNLLHLLLYMLCFAGVGMQVSLYQALFFNSVSRLVSLVAIVPGNIGIQQAVMGVAGSLMGEVFHSGVMASLLQSAALMIVYIVMGGAFAFPVWRRWKNGSVKP